LILFFFFSLSQPLAVVYGWPIVQEFLEGAHDMDRHFVEKPPRHNIPILLALTDVWNDVLKESSSPVARIVTPFAKALTHFPKFVGALESQMCSKSSPSSVQNGRPMGRTSARPVGHKSGLASMYNGCSSIVVDGGTEGMYDRSLLQSENTLINSELIMIMDSQVQFHVARSTMASSGIVTEAQDAQMCAFFAHADELAFGGTKTERNNPHNAPWTSTTAASVTSKTTFSHFQHVGDSDWSEGNRPSTLLMCGRLDAFSCGQLISLSEHRATVKAHIWGIDPFVREVGSELCRERTEELQAELAKMFTETSSVPDGEEKAEEDDLQLCLSTKTILRHYSKLYEGREKL
jgi:glucose-6-phosphate isomerase